MPSSVLHQFVGGVTLVVADVDRDDLVVEAALGGRLGGASVALGRERVEVLARDVPLVGDHLGADALVLQSADRLVARGDARTEGPAGVLADRRAHGDARHHFDAGGDDDVVGAGHDALGGEVQRLLGRAALAVDGRGRHRLGPAGREHRAASDVEGLLADLGDAAHDDVVDQRGVEVVATGDRLQGLGGEVDGVPVLEFSVALAPGRAHRVHDHCCWHCRTFRPRGQLPTGGILLVSTASVAGVSERKSMDRWLGDGGMAIIGAIGGAFESYGVDGEDLGWVSGSFTPTQLACNPHGAVQAGVHSVILDAAMNFCHQRRAGRSRPHRGDDRDDDRTDAPGAAGRALRDPRRRGAPDAPDRLRRGDDHE